VVEERVMEGMRASQLRDVSEMEEMVGRIFLRAGYGKHGFGHDAGLF
jgi:hypothetical protein